MKKYLLAALCAVGLSAPVFAQTTNVTATNLKMGGNPIAVGTITITPVSRTGDPISFTDATGSLNDPTGFTGAIVNGVINPSYTVPDQALSTATVSGNPLYYSISIYNTNTKKTFSFIVPPGTVTGSTFALDHYAPTQTAAVLSASAVGATLPSSLNCTTGSRFILATGNTITAVYECVNGTLRAVPVGSGSGTTDYNALQNRPYIPVAGTDYATPSTVISAVSAETTRATNAENANATAITNERATATNASNISKGQLAAAQMPARSNGNVLFQSVPYNSNTYANTFTTVGTAPPLDAFGRLQPNSTAGSETGMQSVIKTFTTNSENWIFDVTLTVVNTPGSTTYGFVLAAKSVNPNAPLGMRLLYSLGTTQPGGPQMDLSTWTGSASGSNIAVSSITSSPVAGGKVRLIFARRGSTMYGIAQNLATGAVNTLTWTDSLADSSGSSILPNASQFALVDYGGTYTINNVTITETSADNPNLCILGDSKSDGVGSQGMRARFASLLDAYGPVDVFAGGGDGTPQVLASLPTIIAKGCKTAIMAAPFYNDLGWGTITASQSQTNYSAIVSTLKAAGVTVKHMLSIPVTVSSPSPSSISSYNTWISSTFSGDTIIDPSVGFNTSTMLTSTGIHPNDAGHLQVAADIIAQGALVATPNGAIYQVPSPLALFGQP